METVAWDMEEIDCQIADRLAQIARLKAEVAALRKQRAALQDAVPRCGNCRHHTRTWNARMGRWSWRCKAVMVNNGQMRNIAKSWPACDKYERL